jgi:hypothetical protein
MIGSFMVSGAATAAPSPVAAGVTPTDSGFWSLEPPVNGYLPGSVAAPAGAPGPVSAQQVWAACGLTTPNTKIVRTFSRFRGQDGRGFYYLPGGTSSLGCGSDKWGYRHIVKNHLPEWESEAAIAGENWRDHADFAIAAALNDPDKVRYRSDNDTFCYSREVYLYDNRTRKYVRSSFPNVPVAHVTKNIITAWPSSSQCRDTP